MNIGVIGGGAIGLLISGYLSSDHNITIYVKRDEQRDSINNKGLFFSHSTKPIFVNSKLIEDMKKEDCVIICVKQSQIPSVFPKLHKADINTHFLFLQNGMGHIKFIKNMNQPVYLGVVEHGALRINDHTVMHSGNGIIKISGYNKTKQESRELIHLLDQPAFPVVMEESWSQLLAEKLVINAVINPLTALFDCKNGYISTNSYIHGLARELCREAALVLGLDDFEEQWRRVSDVVEKTAENTSSMCKDIKDNRKTEIEAITGYLIENKKNINIPYTSFVYNSIKALEVKKGITG
ncbi:hypothetical protein CIL05_08475 [Virgibacillus profundi]|uniref:2-dehydropantoate 2-reductase n=1 Tax=Virgibacillus profundi TaxID=2024555 RepID=A0A2A2IF83_9BACI|nr:2-dehydropantoate 2-reductase [Virgibacillus profundi]PAV29904.1 hypothetical protein CIL05_08475 [Virgibacillus profundi]PXY54076.1 2-dehydropantoate 2-reductase [Virgibacillus profundi]